MGVGVYSEQVISSPTQFTYPADTTHLSFAFVAPLADATLLLDIQTQDGHNSLAEEIIVPAGQCRLRNVGPQYGGFLPLALFIDPNGAQVIVCQRTYND